jgi:hypothetical protein
MVCGDPPGFFTHRFAGQTSRKPGAFRSRAFAEGCAPPESKKSLKKPFRGSINTLE